MITCSIPREKRERKERDKTRNKEKRVKDMTDDRVTCAKVPKNIIATLNSLIAKMSQKCRIFKYGNI
jgi:hypothetical protein